MPLAVGSTLLSMGNGITAVYNGAEKVWPLNAGIETYYNTRMLSFNVNGSALYFASDPDITVSTVNSNYAATIDWKVNEKVGGIFTGPSLTGSNANRINGKPTFDGTGASDQLTVSAAYSGLGFGSPSTHAARRVMTTSEGGSGNDLGEVWARFDTAGNFVWASDGSTWTASRPATGQLDVVAPYPLSQGLIWASSLDSDTTVGNGAFNVENIVKESGTFTVKTWKSNSQFQNLGVSVVVLTK